MNTLLVTVDSLRADRITERVMPQARSFADGGLEFTDCVANGSSTPASFPAIHASRHFASVDGLGLPARGEGDVVTLAERLSDAGYVTAGFTDNHFASGSYQFDRGFDHVHDAGGTAEAGSLKQFVQSTLDKDGLLFRTIERTYTAVDGLLSAAAGGAEYERAASLNERALSWIDNQDGDWFVWLHYMDPHHPYEPPAKYQRTFLDESVGKRGCRSLSRTATHHPEEVSDADWATLEALYDAECRYVDEQFGALLDALKDRGIRGETLTVFTADHGELFGEHGKGGHPGEFWEGVIHVPLVVDSVTGRTTEAVDDQVRLLDLPPTVTDALGLASAREWHGKSALAVADGADPAEYAFGDVGRAIDYRKGYVRRADEWKLLDHHEDGEHLFDVRATPTELPDEERSDDRPETLATLRSALTDHRERMRELRSESHGVGEDSEMVEDHLEDLGYL